MPPLQYRQARQAIQSSWIAARGRSQRTEAGYHGACSYLPLYAKSSWKWATRVYRGSPHLPKAVAGLPRGLHVFGLLAATAFADALEDFFVATLTFR